MKERNLWLEDCSSVAVVVGAAVSRQGAGLDCTSAVGTTVGVAATITEVKWSVRGALVPLVSLSALSSFVSALQSASATSRRTVAKRAVRTQRWLTSSARTLCKRKLTISSEPAPWRQSPARQTGPRQIASLWLPSLPLLRLCHSQRKPKMFSRPWQSNKTWWSFLIRLMTLRSQWFKTMAGSNELNRF